MHPCTIFQPFTNPSANSLIILIQLSENVSFQCTINVNLTFFYKKVARKKTQIKRGQKKHPTQKESGAEAVPTGVEPISPP